MGSLRNPVGPLPSTIYWRRRAVALCLVALLALLTVWAVTSGGGGGKKPNDSANGSSPTPPSITPGPSGSGPAISQQPGGRDESDEGDETPGANGGSGAGGSGSGGTDAGADAGTGSGGADSAGPAGAGDPDKNGDGDGAGGDGGAGTGAGQQLPADSPLPNCPAGSLQLTLKSVKVTYETGEKPRFQLVAKNTSATACKADFGPRNAVLTISDAKDDEVWSSAHCPRPGTPLLLRLPAGATVTHAVEWDRGRSAPRCATPPAGKAGPGTYLVEAAMPGAKILPASFTLAKD
ncbi:hypothetical protein ACIPQA_14330 [Streptomyces sp. NPDC090109]|uniref:hypothetical protein n=1 Tax=unclassified Streptomyces TaxID=2593676 RepID=UPI000EF7FA64|nr:hypothetical protein [Streptomyces sp. S1]